MQPVTPPRLVPVGVANPELLARFDAMDLSTLERMIRQIDPNWLTTRIGFGPSDGTATPQSATVNGPNRGDVSFLDRLPRLVPAQDLATLVQLAPASRTGREIVFRNPAHRFVPIEGRVRIHFENCASGTIDYVDRSRHGFTVDELPREQYTAERLLREMEDRGHNGQAVDFEYLAPIPAHLDDDHDCA